MGERIGLIKGFTTINGGLGIYPRRIKHTSKWWSQVRWASFGWIDYFKYWPRGRFLDKMVVLDGVLLDATVTLPWCSFFFSHDPLLLEILLHYIVSLYSILPSTCLPSSLVLEFLSPLSQLFDFLGVKVVENTVQRSSPH